MRLSFFRRTGFYTIAFFNTSALFGSNSIGKEGAMFSNVVGLYIGSNIESYNSCKKKFFTLFEHNPQIVINQSQYNSHTEEEHRLRNTTDDFGFFIMTLVNIKRVIDKSRILFGLRSVGKISLYCNRHNLESISEKGLIGQLNYCCKVCATTFVNVLFFWVGLNKGLLRRNYPQIALIAIYSLFILLIWKLFSFAIRLAIWLIKNIILGVILSFELMILLFIYLLPITLITMFFGLALI